MCPNIKKINIKLDKYLSMVIVFSPSKLEVIEEVHIQADQSKSLDLLVRKYGKSLKGLKVVLKGLSSDELKTCFAHISRFESLQSLDTEISFTREELPLEQCLQLLANELTKLRELRFKTYRSLITLNRFFFAFDNFRSLERLIIDFGDTKQKLEGSVECLKHCTRLKHLSITYKELSREFFANIHTILPNLRFLDIKCFKLNPQSIKLFVVSLQSMNKIERIVINGGFYIGSQIIMSKLNYLKNRLKRLNVV